MDETLVAVFTTSIPFTNWLCFESSYENVFYLNSLFHAIFTEWKGLTAKRDWTQIYLTHYMSGVCFVTCYIASVRIENNCILGYVYTSYDISFSYHFLSLVVYLVKIWIAFSEDELLRPPQQ